MDCNSVEGILTYLTSLEGLNNLVRDRLLMHQDDKKLDKFVVLGKWYLKDDGDICLVNLANNDIPYVIKIADEKYSTETLSLVNYHNRLPPHNVHCPKCLEKFNLENAHETYVCGDYTFVDLWRSEAKTLFAVKKMIEKVNDSECFFTAEEVIYRLINPEEAIEIFARNLTSLENYFTSNMDEIFRKCVEYIPTYKEKAVWAGDDNYLIQLGDYASYYKRQYYHEACYREVNNEKMRRKYMEIFAKAGFGKIESKAVSNEECSEACCADWYLFDTEIGRILFYKQKNVYMINYSQIGNMLSCFELETAEKTDGYIHADSEEQAIDFLERIRRFKK